MNKITENAIENFCIDLLKKQSYEYLYVPNITPYTEKPLFPQLFPQP